MTAPWFRWSEDEAEPVEPIVPIVPNVPAPPAFPEDERDILAADEWDDMHRAEFLVRPSWASDGEDDPLYPSR